MMHLMRLLILSRVEVIRGRNHDRVLHVWAIVHVRVMRGDAVLICIVGRRSAIERRMSTAHWEDHLTMRCHHGLVWSVISSHGGIDLREYDGWFEIDRLLVVGRG